MLFAQLSNQIMIFKNILTQQINLCQNISQYTIFLFVQLLWLTCCLSLLNLVQKDSVGCITNIPWMWRNVAVSSASILVMAWGAQNWSVPLIAYCPTGLIECCFPCWFLLCRSTEVRLETIIIMIIILTFQVSSIVQVLLCCFPIRIFEHHFPSWIHFAFLFPEQYVQMSVDLSPFGSFYLGQYLLGVNNCNYNLVVT